MTGSDLLVDVSFVSFQFLTIARLEVKLNKMMTRLERCYPNGPPLYEHPPPPPLPGILPAKYIPPVPMKPLPPIPTVFPSASPPSLPNSWTRSHATWKTLDGSMPAPLGSKSPVSSSSAGGSQSASSTWSLGTLHHQFLNEHKTKASALLDSHDR